MVLLPNATVTLRNPATGQTLPLSVNIYPAFQDARLLDWAASYHWAVVLPTSATYADGSAIATGHQIEWSYLGTASDGTANSATLGKVRKTFGILPTWIAYFNEVD